MSTGQEIIVVREGITARAYEDFGEMHVRLMGSLSPDVICVVLTKTEVQALLALCEQVERDRPTR